MLSERETATHLKGIDEEIEEEISKGVANCTF
jgi:hypothetical protein